MSEYSTDKSIQAELQELSEKYGVKLEVVISEFGKTLNSTNFKDLLNTPEIQEIDNLEELTPWLAANILEEYLSTFQKARRFLDLVDPDESIQEFYLVVK